MPCSCAASMIACESASLVNGPKFIVPRQRRDTDRPERPRWVNCMIPACRASTGAVHAGCQTGTMARPEIVSAAQWQVARDELLAAEKQATRVQDQLAA